MHERRRMLARSNNKAQIIFQLGQTLFETIVKANENLEDYRFNPISQSSQQSINTIGGGESACYSAVPSSVALVIQ